MKTDPNYIGVVQNPDPWSTTGGFFMDHQEITALNAAIGRSENLRFEFPSGAVLIDRFASLSDVPDLPTGTKIFTDPTQPKPGAETVWLCKIGLRKDIRLPPTADVVMRALTRDSFFTATGLYPDICFSGWGGSLTIAEQVVVGQVKMDESRYLYPGPGGALMSSHEIEGLTQDLMKDSCHHLDSGYKEGDTAEFYGGRWMICETMMPSAQRKIAEALGVTYRETPLQGVILDP